MLMLKKPEPTENKLELGDYVSIHMLGLRRGAADSAEPGETQPYREKLFQRIQKQRGEVVPRIEKPRGDLIDVRLRPAAVKKGWVHFSGAASTEDKIVA